MSVLGEDNFGAILWADFYEIDLRANESAQYLEYALTMCNCIKNLTLFMLLRTHDALPHKPPQGFLQLKKFSQMTRPADT
jgi:hypothetical protein